MGVVIVTMCPASRTEAFSEDADGFLLKGFGAAELREAVFGAAGRGARDPSTGSRRDHGTGQV